MGAFEIATGIVDDIMADCKMIVHNPNDLVKLRSKWEAAIATAITMDREEHKGCSSLPGNSA